MISDQIVKKRERERQYLTIVMESLQYVARQGIALRGNDDFDDNFTQLLLLCAKDHPWIKERIMSKHCGGTKKYIHHHFQDEILDIMAKQVLRKKLYDVNNSKMFASMCDEYTDVSNNNFQSVCGG